MGSLANLFYFLLWRRTRYRNMDVGFIRVNTVGWRSYKLRGVRNFKTGA